MSKFFQIILENIERSLIIFYLNVAQNHTKQEQKTTGQITLL